jgi:hypothetical protein
MPASEDKVLALHVSNLPQPVLESFGARSATSLSSA